MNDSIKFKFRTRVGPFFRALFGMLRVVAFCVESLPDHGQRRKIRSKKKEAQRTTK